MGPFREIWQRDTQRITGWAIVVAFRVGHRRSEALPNGLADAAEPCARHSKQVRRMEESGWLVGSMGRVWGEAMGSRSVRAVYWGAGREWCVVRVYADGVECYSGGEASV